MGNGDGEWGWGWGWGWERKRDGGPELPRLCYRAPDVPRPLAPLWLALAGSLASCAAPLEDGRPCSAADAIACGEGRSCVTGRCRFTDAPPSPPDALRVVLAPVDLAVVASGGSGGGGADLPAAVALGRGSSGTVVMLFRFAATWRDDAEVVSAFLVLDALEGSPPSSSPITFEMARIAEPWQAPLVSWGRQPRLGVPKTAGTVRARPSVPLRVDVTPLVRDWQKRDAADHGIALLARGSDAYGAVVTTGVSQGGGPRLEVYVK
jgi:hypothetical protein